MKKELITIKNIIYTMLAFAIVISIIAYINLIVNKNNLTTVKYFYGIGGHNTNYWNFLLKGLKKASSLATIIMILFIIKLLIYGVRIAIDKKKSNVGITILSVLISVIQIILVIFIVKLSFLSNNKLPFDTSMNIYYTEYTFFEGMVGMVYQFIIPVCLIIICNIFCNTLTFKKLISKDENID